MVGWPGLRRVLALVLVAGSLMPWAAVLAEPSPPQPQQAAVDLARTPPAGWSVTRSNLNDGSDATSAEWDQGNCHPNCAFTITFTRQRDAAALRITAFRVKWRQVSSADSTIGGETLSCGGAPIWQNRPAGPWRDNERDTGVVQISPAVVGAEGTALTCTWFLHSTFSAGTLYVYALELYGTTHLSATPVPTPVPTPVRTAAPAPVVTPPPAPVRTSAPAPVVTAAPAPVRTAAPVPAATPAPVTTESPAAQVTAPPPAAPTVAAPVPPPARTASSAPAPSSDPGAFPFEGFELVQVVQTARGDVPMVAGRKTLVRVFLRDTGRRSGDIEVSSGEGGEGGASIPHVQGRLRVEPGGYEVVSSTGPLTFSGDPRASLERTLNFIIPASATASGGSMMLHFDLRADGFAPYTERHPVAFTRRTLRIGYVALCAPGGNCPSEERIARYGAFIRRTFPVGEKDLAYFRLQMPALTWPFALSSNAISEVTGVLSGFKGMSVFVTKLFALAEVRLPDTIVVWYPMEPSPEVPGTSAFGMAFAQEWPDDFDALGSWVGAHEIGHNLGLNHVDRAADLERRRPESGCGPATPGTDWPSGSAYIGAWGFDSETEQLVPPTSKDFMSYCSRPLGALWVSPFHYRKLFDRTRPVVAGDEDPGAVYAAAESEQVLLSGWIARDGPGSFDTPYRVTGRPSDLTPVSVNAPHCLVFRSRDAVTGRHCFAVEMTEHGTGAPLAHTPFIVRTVLPPLTERVVLTRGGAEIAAIASRRAFTLTVTEPRPNTELRGQATLRWEGAPEGARYAVVYSPDDRRTWLPLAMDLEKSEFTIDTTHLARTEQAYFKITASSGLDGASVTVGPVQVPEGRYPRDPLPQAPWSLGIDLPWLLAVIAAAAALLAAAYVARRSA